MQDLDLQSKTKQIAVVVNSWRHQENGLLVSFTYMYLVEGSIPAVHSGWAWLTSQKLVGDRSNVYIGIKMVQNV